jgi:hypothetical protein
MDMESRDRWVEYSKAKDEMFFYTDIEEAPWYVVNADVKKRARLNCLSHILQSIPYRDIMPAPITLSARKAQSGYQRPDIKEQKFVPEKY